MLFKTLRSYPIISVLSLLSFSIAMADEVPWADFETTDYKEWKTTGIAFGIGPAKGTFPGQMTVSGYLGERLCSSFNGGDGATGTLESPAFTLSKPYITFLIGGGGFPEKTCVNLLVDDRIVRSATGPNTKPGGTEELSLQFWDVSEFAGKEAKLKIIDEATGSWGHINVDHIVFTDTRPPVMIPNASIQLKAEKSWLLFPISNDAEKRKVTLTIDGKAQPPLEMKITDQGAPDWWAPMNIVDLKDKPVDISIDLLREDSQALQSIKQSDTSETSTVSYREPSRPQFHFSPKTGWLNDPNGLVYHNGKWHLYFQYNPYGNYWANMHWGHASSTDLMHWKDHGTALKPDETGTMFSGSGVVDWENSSGFGSKEKPPLVFLYTAAGKEMVQSLAYSNDEGKTLLKYNGNPVVPQITSGNRDPKVIWHKPSKKWVMVLYIEKDKKHLIQFLTSTDLKKWSYASELESFYECPDFFELKVEGKPGETLWMLTGAAAKYMLGNFDGTTFQPVTPQLPGYGIDSYAAQTYSDAPDGRVVQIGWLKAESPGMNFNQCMSLPLELGATETAQGPRLTIRPSKEVSALEGIRKAVIDPAKPVEMTPVTTDFKAVPIEPETLKLDLSLTPEGESEIHLDLRGAKITYRTTKQEITVNGQTASAPLIDGKLHLTIYLDRTTLEIFSGKGAAYFPIAFLAKPENRQLGLSVNAGKVLIESLTVTEMKSIWNESANE